MSQIFKKLVGIVQLGNAQTCIIVRIGEVPIQLTNVNSIISHQVQHVPELRSLVSIGMLAEVEYRRTLSESSWLITKGNLKISHGGKYKLYPLNLFNRVPIQLPNDNIITLHHVGHVSNLKRSLISIGILVEDGYKTTLNESSWHITRGNLRIGHGVKYNNLYLLRLISLEGSLNIAEVPTTSLWHG